MSSGLLVGYTPARREANLRHKRSAKSKLTRHRWLQTDSGIESEIAARERYRARCREKEALRRRKVEKERARLRAHYVRRKALRAMVAWNRLEA